MLILGLDISTSYTGIALLESNGTPTPTIVLLDAIDYHKCKNFWDKVDKSDQYLKTISAFKIDGIFVEDPAKKFTSGASSAQTIVTLARFNGLVSYLARNVFSKDPEYLAPGAARKLCGLKMLQKNKDPLARTHKVQTFDAIMSTDLSHITWPTKRNSTKIIDSSYDIVDAYVIAKAGLNTLI